MENITAFEVQKITRQATEAILYTEKSYPYLDSYKDLNKAIVERAEAGENSISFDFVDTITHSDSTVGVVQHRHNRIYLSTKGGQAEYEVFDYPNYLLSKGFGVEIRKPQRQHGYIAKSYFITW